jgi:hypothetical protein
LNVVVVDESELVRRLRNQISQLDKDMVGLHAMAALVKKKSELATAVEQHALDRLRMATESLSCKHSTPFFYIFLFGKNLILTCFFLHLQKSLLSMNRRKTRESMRLLQ